MELKTIQQDMIAAMKAHDKPRKEALSSMVSAIKKAGIDQGCRDNITPELVATVLTKELRIVKEQIDTCPPERQDLIDAYTYRYNVIKEYAPSMMSAEEVEAYLKENCADALASKNMGKIMKAAMAGLKGKADGKIINQVVRKLIA